MAGFGLFDFHRADDMIECGVTACRRDIDDIKREIAARRVTREAGARRLNASPRRSVARRATGRAVSCA